MKRIIALCLSLLIITTTSAKSNKDLNEADLASLQKAVSMADNPATRLEALNILDSLCTLFPKNHIVNYEKIYILYLLGEYEQVLKHSKKWLKAKNSTPLFYQLCGNSLSIQGKPDEAVKMYTEGLKKYPDAGMLYLETGNVYMQNGYNEQAINWYDKGIANDPDFASNYYRGAELYFETPEPVWGLVYAETEMLLNPNNSERFSDMARAISQCYDDKIIISTPDSILKLNVNLTASHETLLLKEKDNLGISMAMPGFTGIFESCVTKALMQMHMSGPASINDRNVEWLSTLRRLTLEAYYNYCHDIYGTRMYLFQFHKKILDSGHWDAYNHFLFSDVYPAQCYEWIEDNPGKMDSFIDWYNDGNTFTLGGDRSVGRLDVYKSVKPISLTDALLMQGSLLSDKDISGLTTE